MGHTGYERGFQKELKSTIVNQYYSTSLQDSDLTERSQNSDPCKHTCQQSEESVNKFVTQIKRILQNSKYFQ